LFQLAARCCRNTVDPLPRLVMWQLKRPRVVPRLLADRREVRVDRRDRLGDRLMCMSAIELAPLHAVPL
jgi:hypothetical protein